MSRVVVAAFARLVACGGGDKAKPPSAGSGSGSGSGSAAPTNDDADTLRGQLTRNTKVAWAVDIAVDGTIFMQPDQPSSPLPDGNRWWPAIEKLLMTYGGYLGLERKGFKRAEDEATEDGGHRYVIVQVHDGIPVSGGRIEITGHSSFGFRDSGKGRPTYLPATAALDIVTHEFTHAMFAPNRAAMRRAGTRPSGEYLSIEEAFGDILGAVVEHPELGRHDADLECLARGEQLEDGQRIRDLGAVISRDDERERPLRGREARGARRCSWPRSSKGQRVMTADEQRRAADDGGNKEERERDQHSATKRTWLAHGLAP